MLLDANSLLRCRGLKSPEILEKFFCVFVQKVFLKNIFFSNNLLYFFKSQSEKIAEFLIAPFRFK